MDCRNHSEDRQRRVAMVGLKKHQRHGSQRDGQHEQLLTGERHPPDRAVRYLAKGKHADRSNECDNAPKQTE